MPSDRILAIMDIGWTPRESPRFILLLIYARLCKRNPFIRPGFGYFEAGIGTIKFATRRGKVVLRVILFPGKLTISTDVYFFLRREFGKLLYLRGDILTGLEAI